MPKLTLLDIVQRALAVTDGDEVNSISDTIEATQVASLVRDCYQDLTEERDLGTFGELVQLEDAASVDSPTMLRIPDDVSLIEWIKYGEEVAGGGAAVTASTTSIVVSQAAAGNFLDIDLTLDGAAVTGGIAYFDAPVNIVLTIENLDGGHGTGTWHIEGTLNGEAVSEDIAIPLGEVSADPPLTSVNTYDTVSLVNFTMITGPDGHLHVGNSAGESSSWKYKLIPRKSTTDFNAAVDARDPTADNVQIVAYGPDSVSLTIVTDKFPSYWFSPDDEYVIFDSWDSSVESTVVATKTKVFATREKTFTLTDAYEIDLPSNMMQYLQAQVQARCFAWFKQQVDAKAEQRENRLRVRTQRSKWRQGRLKHEGPDFGR